MVSRAGAGGLIARHARVVLVVLRERHVAVVGVVAQAVAVLVGEGEWRAGCGRVGGGQKRQGTRISLRGWCGWYLTDACRRSALVLTVFSVWGGG